MVTPRVISLDLDDTLWPVGPVIAAAEERLLTWLRHQHPEVAHGHDVDSMRAMRVAIAKQYPQQSHDMTFLRRQALVEQFAAAGLATPLADEALEIFMIERNRVEFYADVLPSLRRLRQHYRLFALSNGNADLERCGIADLFDGHITAIAAGAGKPDARIFAELLRLASVDAIEILHIGDDPLADVVGATRAGMQAVWLNRESREWPSQFATPRRTVSTLAEIS